MKKENIVNYLKTLINKKDLLIKLIFLLVSTITISLLAFLLRERFINSPDKFQPFLGNFIIINIKANKGLAFSRFENQYILAYILQSLFVTTCLLIAIFSRDKVVFACLWCAGFAGMCNLIDRGLEETFAYNGETYVHAVVDYFQFSFIKNPEFSAIFNIQDVTIVCSMITLFIYLIILFIKKWRKENETNLS